MSQAKIFIQELLQEADIEINGHRPWDIQVHDDGFFNDVLARGNLALGEAYMAGEWDCEQLDEFFHRLLSARIGDKIKPSRLLWHHLKSRFLNLQNTRRAWKVGEHHYDIGNRLYQQMLDKRMVYTCGYWNHAQNLDQAQRNKLELTCQKLQLQPGMKILDIGCGWGSFMKYAAENYGVECVGVTISKEQVRLGEELCKGLPVEFRLQDYRDLNEKFDAIVSLGMFEHVGQRNYKDYFKVVERCLRDDGLFLLHTIGRNRDVRGTDPWISKYIFPNGELPCLAHIDDVSRDLVCAEDVHNFGADYDPTLMDWYRNFEANWPKLEGEYDMTFFRMWRYYLLSCAGAFRARDLQLWQWVFSKRGVTGGYHRPRLDSDAADAQAL
ncbi:cyclopropane fatty acyl phospholipid synthase [Pseudidiomarina salinarum]|uniref:Cyclopropane fatty acyl phospholipid synthase n=1 Tax=Pseudidiomarina salinarum TaxID=435908 RepID=A0A094ITI1_9GAMM|nr:cyclopropane fatty acyl phospholipid synthase [Pseudidiomarina salinarum]KFZ30427.1 cyclopropane fatty acyl phospholipid synthase [Pseudidiomarina salinarum]RUO68579.1 cyclopropane-fatty-acyl-phospholipid synthase [Pseudidiomarina salinarum]